jgi:peptide/nickel transport system substrate-binding protein
MAHDAEHPAIPKLKQQLAEARIDRRNFLRTTTLLGLSATAAYAFADRVEGRTGQALAQASPPPRMGGTIRIQTRIDDPTNAHAAGWIANSNLIRQVCDYLVRTDTDNVTRPWLVESWQPSEDLKTWTLKLRRDVKWHNGRQFNADDVVWNITRWLDPAVGSSSLGLMRGYMLEQFDTGQVRDGRPVMSTRLWDSKAIEKVDDFTVRLNLKEPQLAVPEHLFNWPNAILDPAQGGRFGVGANGTGPYELVALEVGRRAVYRAKRPYWQGTGPYADEIQYLDIGQDPAALLGALASRQVDMLYEADVTQLEALRSLPGVRVAQVPTAQCGVARMKVGERPFNDPRVRLAMKLAIDPGQILQVAGRGIGAPGEHHHVAPIHPEYAPLPGMGRDVARAKALLAEAGFPNGFDTEIYVRNAPAWEPTSVQAMVEQWKDIGARVRINVVPQEQMRDLWLRVPFCYTSWGHRPLGVMVLAIAYRTGVPFNESNYANPAFDALLTRAEGTADVEARRVMMGQLQTMLQQDGPIVQPFWRGIYTGVSTRLQGFNMHPTFFHFCHEWSVTA